MIGVTKAMKAHLQSLTEANAACQCCDPSRWRTKGKSILLNKSQRRREYSGDRALCETWRALHIPLTATVNTTYLSVMTQLTVSNWILKLNSFSHNLFLGKNLVFLTRPLSIMQGWRLRTERGKVKSQDF